MCSALLSLSHLPAYCRVWGSQSTVMHHFTLPRLSRIGSLSIAVILAVCVFDSALLTVVAQPLLVRCLRARA